jgi:ketosteroid isomerase-like protein
MSEGRRAAARAGIASAAMSDEEAREELHRLEQEWMQAHQTRDEARLEELVADGFRFTAIHLHPEPMTREQWMGAALGGYTITTFAFEEMEIAVFGQTAVVHARYSQIASYSTVNLSNVFRLTDVWSKHSGSWQVVARHSSVLG